MRKGIAGYAIEGARGARDRMTERPDRIDEGELRGALRRGRMLARLRIDPSEKVQHAEPADGSFAGSAFVDAGLSKARRWTFEPTGGRTEDVIYPFVFLLPK
jgi:hypothetical protein